MKPVPDPIPANATVHALAPVVFSYDNEGQSKVVTFDVQGRTVRVKEK